MSVCRAWSKNDAKLVGADPDGQTKTKTQNRNVQVETRQGRVLCVTEA